MSAKKVLVVDDEPKICNLFSEYLKRQGCEVYAVLDGVEAWELFQKEMPGVCLIDIRLGDSDIDGYELLHKIRAVDKETYCVMLTAESDLELERKSKRLGANEHLEKGLDAKAFMALMKRLSAANEKLK